jgi:hypothetical protein
MRIQQAIPTEYAGVKYASKSEAIFARCLDLAGQQHEPQYNYCRHAWDFRVIKPKKWVQSWADGVWSAAAAWPEEWADSLLIEYKPSTPTWTYIDNLMAKMKTAPTESIIVWGSPYQSLRYVFNVRPLYSRFWKYGWGDYWDFRDDDNPDPDPAAGEYDLANMLGVTDEIANIAKQYRYDLV